VYDDILIPTDGSEDAAKGMDHGLELAANLGARVHALYVIDLPGAPRAVYIRDDEEEMRREYREYGEKVTGDVCDAASQEGLECVAAIRTGAPAEEIVNYAEDEGVDAIVMGSAYKGKFTGILGSTAERVVRTATVPVTTHRMLIDD
jgi:nucleotide-binding universal stress UspA family protein